MAVNEPAIINSGKNNKQKDMDVNDHVDVVKRRFYFVKPHEFRNPDLVDVEKFLDLRFTVSQMREEKLVQRNQLQSALQNQSFYHAENWNRMRDGLRLLRRCMNDRIRLSIANTDNDVSKEAKRNAFRTLHGSSSLAKERKVVKQMNEARSSATKLLANTSTCCEDCLQIMGRLEYNLRQTKHDPCKQEEILVEIQQLRHAKEEASENADHQGKLPASSGCREDVEKKIKDAIQLLEGGRERLLQNNKEFALSVKELREVEKELASLEKQLSEIDEVMCGYYRSLAQWRKQYQEENACHDENVSLLCRAGTLADEKNLATLGSLSEGQVQEFMGRWNEDAEFRNKYKRRAKTSLNSRGLCGDVRTRNPDEEPIVLDRPNIKPPNRIRKLLIKQLPT